MLWFAIEVAQQHHYYLYCPRKKNKFGCCHITPLCSAVQCSALCPSNQVQCNNAMQAEVSSSDHGKSEQCREGFTTLHTAVIRTKVM